MIVPKFDVILPSINAATRYGSVSFIILYITIITASKTQTVRYRNMVVDLVPRSHGITLRPPLPLGQVE